MAMKRAVKRSAEADDILLEEVFEDFIAEKEAHGLSPATITGYRGSFEKFKGFMGDNNTGDTINETSIFKWIGTMRNDGIKHTSINHYLRDVRAFLYWCMDISREYISPPFKITQVKGQDEGLKLFTEEEQETLIEKPHRKASFVEYRTWAIVNWVLATGNRAATICEVKLQDINFSRHEIILAHTKNKKASIIPMSAALEAVLKEYIRLWRKDANSTEYLFPNVGVEKLTTNALRQSFAKYCKDRDIERTNIHGLRHSFAKGWIMNNGNTFALQKVLGHSTLDMTRKYVNLFSEDIKEDYEMYSPLDNLKKGMSRTRKIKRSD
jgi:integrase/recombinase XerD